MVLIKITEKKVLFSLVLVISILLVTYYLVNIPKPIYSWNYHGNMIGFRADLKEAKKVPVYPFEAALYNEINSQLIQNITFLFKPADESENPYYILQEIEIVQKLTLLFKRIQISPGFDANKTESYENIFGKIQNPIIVLVHPRYANETSVTVTPNHVIYIQGKSNKEFDMATTKFLMTAMGIDPDQLEKTNVSSS
jgi:hypothetical protein